MSKSKVNKPGKMVEVYRAAGEVEAQVIKGLLESHGISCFLKSNVGTSSFGVTMGEVKVIVWEEVAEKAKELIGGEGNA